MKVASHNYQAEAADADEKEERHSTNEIDKAKNKDKDKIKDKDNNKDNLTPRRDNVIFSVWKFCLLSWVFWNECVDMFCLL